MTYEFTLAIPILARTPDALRAMLAGLPPVWTDATEGPETWSPYVIVGISFDGEPTDWIPRARIILAQGTTVAFQPSTVRAVSRE